MMTVFDPLNLLFVSIYYLFIIMLYKKNTISRNTKTSTNDERSSLTQSAELCYCFFFLSYFVYCQFPFQPEQLIVKD